MALVIGGRALAIPLNSSTANCVLFPSIRPAIGDKCIAYPHPTKAGYYILLKPKKVYVEDNALAIPVGKGDYKRVYLVGNVRNYFPKLWQRGFTMTATGGDPVHQGWDCSLECQYYSNPQPCYIAQHGSIANTGVYCSYTGGGYRIPTASADLYSCNKQIIDQGAGNYCSVGRQYGCKKYTGKNQTLTWFTTGAGICRATNLLTKTQSGATTYSCNSSCRFYSNHYTPCLRGRTVPLNQRHFNQQSFTKPCPNGPMLFSGYLSAGSSESSYCSLEMGKATEFAQVRTTGEVAVVINNQSGSLCDFSPRTGGMGSAGTTAPVSASVSVPQCTFYQGLPYCPPPPAPLQNTGCIFGSQSDRR